MRAMEAFRNSVRLTRRVSWFSFSYDEKLSKVNCTSLMSIGACLMATISEEPFLVIICVGSSWDDDVLSSQVFTVGSWFPITDAHIFLILMSENVEACYTYCCRMFVGVCVYVTEF